LNKQTIHYLLIIFYSIAFLSTSTPSHAVNWLMLQGTEHPLAPAHRFWGFFQPAYSHDTSDDLSGLTAGFTANNGERLAITTIPPEFDKDSQLHLRRARFGVRGIFTGDLRNSFTSKMNYFTFFEVAPNLMTYDSFGKRKRAIALDHLSITFNHIKGARIRTGLFKTPGPEETFQGVHTLDYIELTDFAAREVIERFVTGAAQPAASPSSVTLGTPVNTAYGINAVRDWGIQIFDSFKKDDWEMAYAAMLGRGEAIQDTDSADNKLDRYLYASAEYDLLGGRGTGKNGLKFYGWHQSGKRRFSTDTAINEYDRTRFGIGAKFLGRPFQSKYKFRIGIELMQAEGMIFIAPTGGVARGNVGNGNLQIAAESGNRSSGSTLDFGFYPNSRWQFDIRMHRHQLLHETATNVNPGNERIFNEMTLGFNYHFSRKTRLTFNYIVKDVEAPAPYASTSGFPPPTVTGGITSNVNTIVNTVDDRVLLQLTWLI